MSVVLSPALVVSPVAGESRINPYLGWRNVVAFDNVTSEHEDADFPITNIANPSTSNRWLSDSSLAQWILVEDLDGESDYVAFAGHNLGTIGAEITVEGEISSVFSEIFSGVVPADDSPLMIRFPKAAYTSIRVNIGASSSPPFVSVMFAGALIVIPTGISPGYTPISEGFNTELVGGRSASGEYLGYITVGSYRESRTPLKLLPRAFYEDTFREFVKAANNGDAFFFAWSPVLRPEQTGYCSFSGVAQPVISQSDGRYDISLPLVGIAS